MKLTDKIVRAADPGSKLTDDGEHGSGRLMLVTSPKGLKTWFFRVQSGGKDLSRKLGRYPEMTLSDAREAARAASGTSIERHATLEQLLETYRDSLKGRPSFKDVSSSMKTNRNILFKKEARSITAADIAEILRPIYKRGATVRMNRFRSMLSAAFTYGGKRDNDPTQPAGAVRFGIVSNPVALVPIAAT